MDKNTKKYVIKIDLYFSDSWVLFTTLASHPFDALNEAFHFVKRMGDEPSLMEIIYIEEA